MPALGLFLAFLLAAQTPPAAQVSEGRQIARRDCGACHATGRFDRSRDRQAPAFRTLGDKYDVGGLAEALAEGISVGHPKMPERAYPPEQIDQLIAYLRSFQPNATKGTR